MQFKLIQGNLYLIYCSPNFFIFQALETVELEKWNWKIWKKIDFESFEKNLRLKIIGFEIFFNNLRSKKLIKLGKKMEMKNFNYLNNFDTNLKLKE